MLQNVGLFQFIAHAAMCFTVAFVIRVKMNPKNDLLDHPALWHHRLLLLFL